MKRRGLFLALVLAALAATVALWFRPDFRPALRGEDLVSDATLLFGDVRDLPLLGRELGQVSLPEGGAGGAAWMKMVAGRGGFSEEWREVMPSIRDLLAKARGQVFFACTAVSVSPRLDLECLAGFEMRDNRREVDEAVKRVERQLRLNFPEAQMEDVEIESTPCRLWKLPRQTPILWTRRAGFFLVSRGEAPMCQALQLARRGTEMRSLASVAAFAASRSEPRDGEVRLFLNPASLVFFLKPLLALHASLQGQVEEMLPFQSLHGRFGVRASLFDERYLWHSKEVEDGRRHGDGEQKSTWAQALKAPSESVLYAAFRGDPAPGGDAALNWLEQAAPMARTAEQRRMAAMAREFLLWGGKTVLRQFGPGMALAVDREGAMSLAAETADATALEEALRRARGLSVREADRAPMGVRLLRLEMGAPAPQVFWMALGGGVGVVSKEREAALRHLAAARGQGESLSDHGDFQRMARGLPSEGDFLFFADWRALLARATEGGCLAGVVMRSASGGECRILGTTTPCALILKMARDAMKGGAGDQPGGHDMGRPPRR